MKTQKLLDHIETFLHETFEIQKELNQLVEKPENVDEIVKKIHFVPVLNNRSTTPSGLEALIAASHELLNLEKLDIRITVETAKKSIEAAILAELANEERNSKFSLHRIIERAKVGIGTVQTNDGLYIFPADIMQRISNFQISFGPAQIVSRDIFEIMLDDALENEQTEFDGMLGSWRKAYKEHHYFIVIKINGFEEEKAFEVGREAAEFILNQIRLVYGWRVSNRICLASDLVPAKIESKLILLAEGDIFLTDKFSGSRQGYGEDWPESIENLPEIIQHLLSAIISRFVRGDSSGEPVFERVRYANLMITEAFYARTNRTRLAHFITSLETLTVIPKEKKVKSSELARRCALASKTSYGENQKKMKSVISSAYQVRNQVLHGAAISDERATTALKNLNPFLFHIVFGLIETLFWIRNQKKPESIEGLQNEMTKLMDQLETKKQ